MNKQIRKRIGNFVVLIGLSDQLGIRVETLFYYPKSKHLTIFALHILYGYVHIEYNKRAKEWDGLY